MVQRVGRGIALLFHDRGTRMWVSGQQHVPAAINPRERPGTHFTGGCLGTRAGVDRCGKSRPPTGFDPRTVQPVAQSQHRLSYRAHWWCVIVWNIRQRKKYKLCIIGIVNRLQVRPSGFRILEREKCIFSLPEISQTDDSGSKYTSKLEYNMYKR